MRLGARIGRAGVLLITLVMHGCDDGARRGPPDLRLGRDECAACGMLIDEERCSSGLVVDDGGRRMILLFDDIGCMLDHEREGLAGGGVLERYVHDHGSKAWVRAESATILMTSPSALRTPMGSGIVAFGGPEAAARAKKEFGGELLDYERAAEAWRKRAEDRRGPGAAGTP